MCPPPPHLSIFRGPCCHLHLKSKELISVIILYDLRLLVKIDHGYFGYLATTSSLTVFLYITHKKRALFKMAKRKRQENYVYKWIKLTS